MLWKRVFVTSESILIGKPQNATDRFFSVRCTHALILSHLYENFFFLYVKN